MRITMKTMHGVTFVTFPHNGVTIECHSLKHAWRLINFYQKLKESKA